MGWFVDALDTDLTPAETVAIHEMRNRAWFELASGVKVVITQSSTAGGQTTINYGSRPFVPRAPSQFQATHDAYMDDPTVPRLIQNMSLLRSNGDRLLVKFVNDSGWAQTAYLDVDQAPPGRARAG